MNRFTNGGSGTDVRFDDRIATVMALPVAHPSARAAKWRQLVDLLAQRRDEGPSEEVEAALKWLAEHRAELDLATRQRIAQSLTGRAVSPLLFGFFADDLPAVAAPLIAGARMSSGQWLAILPRLSQTTRALLRNRRDLDPAIKQALASFGASDLGIAGTIDETAAKAGVRGVAERGEAQIRDLVARIEAFRKQRAGSGAETPAIVDTCGPIDGFRWEAGSDGVILWVEGAPRGPLVGQTIAAIAGREQFGVDGQAAGAFEKRAPFRDARFSVAGSGAASGDWRISGVPFFDPHSGSFLGYRGSARRPRLDEVALAQPPEPAARGIFGNHLPADSLRQLIHELRTPLNAIVGFAEMIDGQYMGPAGQGYRSRAAEIMEQAGRLLSAVDDLDTAARIETRRLTLDESSVDAVGLLWRLHQAYERVAQQRGARLALDVANGLPAAKAEAPAAERMFARMLAATIGLAEDGETILASMTLGRLGAQTMLWLAIDRPSAIQGLEETVLLDPGYGPDGDWPAAPALGLGFSLRLVRNLAEAVGGALHIEPQRFSLYLPPVEVPELSTGQGS
ncbi:MAG: sensor histidine kinase [Pseudomonadota bacterium]|nr:sensor histidine kinase [Pseudomonadota bacterium]